MALTSALGMIPVGGATIGVAVRSPSTVSVPQGSWTQSRCPLLRRCWCLGCNSRTRLPDVALVADRTPSGVHQRQVVAGRLPGVLDVAEVKSLTPRGVANIHIASDGRRQVKREAGEVVGCACLARGRGGCRPRGLHVFPCTMSSRIRRTSAPNFSE